MDKLILIIDDEDINRILYKEFLSNWGYKVTEASDGIIGLQKAIKLKPDFIILDMKLPKLSGGEVYKELKRNPKTVDIPVIVVSAFVNTYMIQQEMPGLPVEDIYSKPINHQKIKEKIDSILQIA